MSENVSIHTLVIGGGQAGLLTGHLLARRGVPFLIVDADARTGDSWRRRWDSLTLFTPNWANGLAGLRFPGGAWVCPSKDEMADYPERYADHHALPIRHGVRIVRLARDGDELVATAEGLTLRAKNVVIAMANLQEPHVPSFAKRLPSRIVQLHAHDYRRPDQLPAGRVLVVGVGNSGAEVAMDLAADHDVELSGDESGVMPFRPDRLSGRIMMPFVGKVLLTRVLGRGTPMGRRAQRRMRDRALPLGRTKPRDLRRAGVVRRDRVVGVEAGQPITADGRRLDVGGIVWCTGYRRRFDWIDLPVYDADGHIDQDHGAVAGQPGLFVVGQRFQHSPLSDTLLGVTREAPWVVSQIA